MEDWTKIINFIKPGNLRDVGNPSYTTLASCLGGNDLLTRYKNGPAKNEDDETKVMNFFHIYIQICN